MVKCAMYRKKCTIKALVYIMAPELFPVLFMDATAIKDFSSHISSPGKK